MDIQVYNSSRQRVAFLENAISISYKLSLNSLWTASFSLPADDPKNAYCLPLYYVEIYDGNERIDLFRIIGEDLTRSDGAERVYACEHVLATLINDLLFQYHQVGGTGTTTDEVLNYILGEQTTENWVLDACAFSRQFEYSFENENLLSALFAVPKAFEVDYRWTWDTTVYPWELSLIELPTAISSEIRYAKNLLEVKKDKDYSTLANRIYALGYGEGVNQLTIKSETVGNVPYVQDSASITAYGLCPTILVDSRFENAATLKSYAEQILAEKKEPYVTYTVSAVDLYRLTGDSISKFVPGEIIRVIDAEDDIAVTTRIVAVEKGNVGGDPGNITVTIANKSQDIAGSISDLQNRARINETYAQGATNLQAQTFADNADASHPLTFKFYIPTETVRINKVQLTVSFEAFRSYSTGAASGGSQEKTSSSKSFSAITSSSADDTFSTSGALSWTSGSNGHNHGISDGLKLLYTNDGTTIAGYDTFVESGEHYHEATTDGHDHSVSIPSHSHTVSIDAHTHDLTFGIYEGTTGTSATVKVDGNSVSVAGGYDDIDIVSALDTDEAGKITRGTWHEVEITPNSMSRIVGSLFIQLFTNSRGGGDY